MADFNFTVRATDDLGAFSERDFSITVNNTMVTQYILSNTQGHIATSVDGVNWTWQLNMHTPSQGGGKVINGNGFWLLTKNRTQYYRSTDGLNWTLYDLPLANTYFTHESLGQIYYNTKFVYGEGKIAFLGFRIAGSTRYYDFISTEDGITWSAIAALNTSTSSISLNFYLFFNQLEYGNGTWFINYNRTTANNQLGYRSVDGGVTWQPAWLTGNYSNFAYGTSRVSFMNGMWMAASTGATYLLSNDTISWSEFSTPTTISKNYAFSNALYANGRIISFPEMYANTSLTTTFTGVPAAHLSVDGINWTVAEGKSPIGFGSSTAYHAYSNIVVSQNYVNSVYHNGKILAFSRIPRKPVMSIDGGDTFTDMALTQVDSTSPVEVIDIATVRLTDS